MVRNSWEQRKGDVMAIEKLSKYVYIDREAKVIYFSALDEASRFLIEMNKEEGFTVKSVSEMPKPKRKSGNKMPKKAAFIETLSPEEKKLFDEEFEKSNKKYTTAYYAVINARKAKKTATAEK